MPVQFFTEDCSFRLKNKRLLKKWLESLIATSHKKTGDINYIFCTDAFLLNLNITYLRHHTLTDIITFPYHTSGDTVISGDIYISVERVRENARLFGATPRHEMHRVIVHGLLHLLGHTDNTKAMKKAMRQLEDQCLSKLALLDAV